MEIGILNWDLKSKFQFKLEIIIQNRNLGFQFEIKAWNQYSKFEIEFKSNLK